MKKWKNIQKIQIIIDELDRLNCEPQLQKWQKPFNDRDNRIFSLTKQQIEELIINFKNDFKELTINNIYEDQIYTYKKLKFKDYTQDKDIFIGKLEKDWFKEVTMKGYNKKGETIEKRMRGFYIDELKYIRESTQEEIDFYELMESTKQYNL